jgi:hypothetical protein
MESSRAAIFKMSLIGDLSPTPQVTSTPQLNMQLYIKCIINTQTLPKTHTTISIFHPKSIQPFQFSTPIIKEGKLMKGYEGSKALFGHFSKKVHSAISISCSALCHIQHNTIAKMSYDVDCQFANKPAYESRDLSLYRAN